MVPLVCLLFGEVFVGLGEVPASVQRLSEEWMGWFKLKHLVKVLNVYVLLWKRHFCFGGFNPGGD